MDRRASDREHQTVLRADMDRTRDQRKRQEEDQGPADGCSPWYKIFKPDC
jgi:hypothetical protein